MHPSNVIERRGAALAADLRVLAAPQLLALDLPPRTPLLGPVLARHSLVLLKAPAGLGKSWLALSLAHAVATGGAVLGWAAPRPARVLYVDATMPLGALQARLAAIEAGAPGPATRPRKRRKKKAKRPAPALPRGLNILAADAQPFALPDLGSAEGRAAFERLIGDGLDLLMLDSVAALLRSGRGRDDPAMEVASWLAGLRRRGLCVLLVDRPSRRRLAAPFDHLLDAVITLRRPVEWDPAEGARFLLRLESARGLAGAAARPFEARLTLADGAATWARLAGLDAQAVQAWRLFKADFSTREIGVRLGVSAATAWRLVERAKHVDPALLAAPPPDQPGEAGEAGEAAEAAEAGEASEAPEAVGTGKDDPLYRFISRGLSRLALQAEIADLRESLQWKT